MMGKKAFIADFTVDMWAAVIYILLIVVLLGVYAVAGGCAGDFDQANTRHTESSVSADYILLNFLRTPVQIEEDITNPNMADLILLAQDNEEYQLQLENHIKRTFNQNFYPWWEIQINYPYGQNMLQFEGLNNVPVPSAASDAGLMPEGFQTTQELAEEKFGADISSSTEMYETTSNNIKNNWLTGLIERHSSSGFRYILDDYRYESMDEETTITHIPSMTESPIKIKLTIQRYPTYPLYHKFPVV